MPEDDPLIGRYRELNGSHAMSEIDDEYCRRVFVQIPDEADYPAARIRELMIAGSLPLPTYVLSDGTPMVHEDYLVPVRSAGGPDALEAWFKDHWGGEDAEVADEVWREYMGGRLASLRSSAPETIRERDQLVDEIRETAVEIAEDGVADVDGLEAAGVDMSGSEAEEESAKARLRRSVDALDDLLTPMTGYDRPRFGVPTVREEWVEMIRADHLSEDDAYRMTLSLNVLNHLGINLYSNLPAILSEAVANAWDADATRVDIDIDPTVDTVTVADNGVGMTRREINERYLNVGYRRREDKKNVAAGRVARVPTTGTGAHSTHRGPRSCHSRGYRRR
ncbi:MAG: ATP-binding protein [Nocardioides sp.]